MIVYISGGCKNGKSSIAENIAKNLSQKANPLYYVATMNPTDKEDEERILNHQKDRKDLGFETIELSKNITDLSIRANLDGTFLLDSVTALLMNEMFDKDINKLAHKKIAKDLEIIAKQVKNIVLVSDYIYSDSIKYDDMTEHYKMALAYIDKKCASFADVVLEICIGNVLIYKGKDKIGGYLC